MGDWILLRHGESVANRERWLAGSVETPLSERGREQARAAGRALAATPLERVLTSDLSRARDTARIALEGRAVPLSVHPELQERNLGVWRGRPISEIRAEAGDRLWSWTFRVEGGESCGDTAARALGFLRTVPEVRGTTLVVAHGGVIRCLLGLVEGTPYAEIGKRKVPNAIPIRLDLGPGGWPGLWERHRATLPRSSP